jgi:hypothetical protein
VTPALPATRSSHACAHWTRIFGGSPPISRSSTGRSWPWRGNATARKASASARASPIAVLAVFPLFVSGRAKWYAPYGIPAACAPAANAVNFGST